MEIGNLPLTPTSLPRNQEKGLALRLIHKKLSLTITSEALARNLQFLVLGRITKQLTPGLV
jgi:hypothetical protein